MIERSSEWSVAAAIAATAEDAGDCEQCKGAGSGDVDEEGVGAELNACAVGEDIGEELRFGDGAAEVECGDDLILDGALSAEIEWQRIGDESALWAVDGVGAIEIRAAEGSGLGGVGGDEVHEGAGAIVVAEAPLAADVGIWSDVEDAEVDGGAGWSGEDGAGGDGDATGASGAEVPGETGEDLASAFEACGGGGGGVLQTDLERSGVDDGELSFSGEAVGIGEVEDETGVGGRCEGDDCGGGEGAEPERGDMEAAHRSMSP